MAKEIYQSYNFNGNLVSGIADGVAVTDAANKGQVDDALLEAKTYTDSKIEGLGEYAGTHDPALGLPTVGTGASGAIDKGDWYYITGTGTLLGVTVRKGDRLQAAVANPDTITNDGTNVDWFILHSFNEEDTRFEIVSTDLLANTPATITHNLGHRFVNVIVSDALGNPVDVYVNYVDENSLTLTSNIAVTIVGAVML